MIQGEGHETLVRDDMTKIVEKVWALYRELATGTLAL